MSLSYFKPFTDWIISKFLANFTGPHNHTYLSVIIWNSPSVQFSSSAVSDSLQPHESQHARPPCPSPTPGVHSDSRPSSLWCHPAISSSVIPFSSCPQSLPASESFPMSQLFAWGDQSTGVSALASVLPKTSQGWSPSEWTGGISEIYPVVPISSVVNLMGYQSVWSFPTAHWYSVYLFSHFSLCFMSCSFYRL